MIAVTIYITPMELAALRADAIAVVERYRLLAALRPYSDAIRTAEMILELTKNTEALAT